MVTEPQTPQPTCRMGQGHSPPARKLAALPLIANTFGSARIWSRRLDSKALMVAATCKSGRKMKMFNRSVKLNCPDVAVPVKFGGVAAWVDVDPTVFKAPSETMLAPSSE